MAKWADYAITAVRFNAKHTHIDKVQAKADKGDTLGSTEEHTRQDVIKAIKDGTTYITVFKGSDDKWQKGQDVFVIKINGTEYIKTKRDDTEQDNLDKLPEF